MKKLTLLTILPNNLSAVVNAVRNVGPSFWDRNFVRAASNGPPTTLFVAAILLFGNVTEAPAV